MPKRIALLLLLFSSGWFAIILTTHSQTMTTRKIQKPTYTPRFEFLEWKFISGQPHVMFGAHLCGLKDVNGDGGNDFAVSTMRDTTFIFFGGKAIDDQADGFVLGGGYAVVSGDFNGDSYPDIATAEVNWQGALDKKYKGKVRVYLHNKTATMYDAEPTITLVGKNYNAELGRGMVVADVNGDKKTDLIIPSFGEKTSSYEGKVYVYLGKEILDTIPDAVLEDRIHNHGDWTRGTYGAVTITPDINGDGMDDLIIRGGEGLPGAQPPEVFYNFEIYFGSKNFNFSAPSIDLSGRDYPFMEWWLYSAKMDGDSCNDLAFTQVLDNAFDLPIVLGRKDSLPKKLPDAIFPNPEPDYYRGGMCVTQVGDLNHDGFDDYFVTWDARDLVATSDYLYLGGKKWDTIAVAHFGILGGRDFFGLAIPLHDIDGDGIDDFGLDRDISARNYYGVRLCRGSERIERVTEFDNPRDIPTPFSLDIYPNPASTKMMIALRMSSTSTMHVSISNIEGKVVKQYHLYDLLPGDSNIPIDLIDLNSGKYFLIARSGKSEQTRTFTITK